MKLQFKLQSILRNLDLHTDETEKIAFSYSLRSRRHFKQPKTLQFSWNEELYVSKEVKENGLASQGKSCRPETIPTKTHYACHDLSAWNKQQKSNFLS